MTMKAATAGHRKTLASSLAAPATRKVGQRGGRNLKTDLASILQKRVAIREDGELRHVTRQEAMLLTLCAKALQGDTKASSQLFAMLTKTESQDIAPSQPDVVTDNDRAIVEDFLRRNSVP